MRLLSFDPGEITGVAAFDEAGNWLFGMTVGEIGLTDKLFQKLTAIVSPDLVLVESPPSFVRSEEAVENYHLIMHWFKTAGYPIKNINPGQWKGMSNRYKISGTHQNDAATMGDWYLWSLRNRPKSMEEILAR